MRKYAFTLAEIMVVLMVVGVLGVMLITATSKLQPDKEKIMFKKAYQITERVVGELVNDERIYPYDESNFGFKNKTTTCIEGSSSIKFGGANKFCNHFVQKVNVSETNGACKFTTSDGIEWEIDGGSFTSDNATIKVKPTSDSSQLSITVRYDGKISVSGETEKEYLRSGEVRKDYKKN